MERQGKDVVDNSVAAVQCECEVEETTVEIAVTTEPGKMRHFARDFDGRNGSCSSEA